MRNLDGHSLLQLLVLLPSRELALQVAAQIHRLLGAPSPLHVALAVGGTDGTDNGDETPLDTRVARVRRALDRGEAVIVFDADSQQCQLALKRDVPKEWLD